MKENRKNLLVLASAILCLGLSSCGSGDAPTSSSTSQQETIFSSDGSQGGESAITKSIKLSAPENGASFNISNETVSQYLNATSVESIVEILEAHKGVDVTNDSIDLSWEKDGSAYYLVYLATDESFENPTIKKVSGLTPHLTVNNLIPGKTYYWKVVGTVENDVSDVRCFHTEGNSVRLIKASGGKNIRDLGGWKTADGSSLAYGKIYRGGLLNGYNGMAKLDEEGIKTFRDELGIKTEIDLRRTESDDGLQSECFFNPEANYVQAEMGQYSGILDTDSWDAVPTDKKSSCEGYGMPSLKVIFDTLANKDNYPVYIHCNAGADRTGTLAFLLEALCGVGESDLIKDFEITSFSTFGARYRSAVEDGKFSSSGVYKNDSGNFVAFGALIEAFKEFYGSSLGEAAEHYLKNVVGVSSKTIEDVKANLIETYAKKEITEVAKGQEILLTSAAKSISLGEVAYDSVSSITLGGVSLGTDLDNLDFSQTHNLGGEKEIVVVVNEGDVQKTIAVPVTIVTKEISTYVELKNAVDFSISSNLYGYYRLTSDIDFGSNDFGAGHIYMGNDYFSARGDKGFRGVLDGNGHKITGRSGYAGLFGSIGAGALIKDVEIIDTTYSQTESNCILGTSVVSATFENVKFSMLSGGGTIATNGIGWLTAYQCQSVRFNNVEFNAAGRKIGNLFGGYTSWLGVCHISFSNSKLYCESMNGLGFKYRESSIVSPYGYSGLSGSIGASIVAKNTVQVGAKEAKIQLGNAYSSTSLISATYKDNPLAGVEFDEGTLYFPVSGNFTNADEGNREVIVKVSFDGGLEVTISATVEVISSLKKVSLSGTSTVELEKATSFSIDMEEFAGATVTSIKLGDTELGSNPSNVALPASIIYDKSMHGEQSLSIFATMNGEDYRISAKLLIVTGTISNYGDFSELCGHYDSTYVKYGYYKLGADIGSSTTSFAWYYDETGSSKMWSSLDLYGFQATIDGDGHSVTGKTVASTWGICGYVGNHASFKNVSFIDYGDLGSKNRSLLGRSIGSATFDNVNFVLEGNGSSVAESQVGWLSCWSIGAASFSNVTFDAAGKDVGTLFGNNTASLTATFDSCTIKAASIDSITRNGNNYVAEADATPGVTLILG